MGDEIRSNAEVRSDEARERVKQLYVDVLACAPADRPAFLDRACAGDEALRREIESLLAFQTDAHDLMDAPALQLAAEILASERGTAIVGRRFGAYRVVRPLGAGGMGEVYLAEDDRLGRRVALKLLPAHFTEDRDRVARFEQEARAASALNHPNILTIYDIGRDCTGGVGIQFMAAEFIDGVTLRHHLANHRPTLREAIEIAIQMAAALDVAHASGIVHRDIKPENVMLRRDGYVKILDFGLAKLTERRKFKSNKEDEETEALGGGEVQTDPGMVVGTVQYMSPEQARGLEVDGRSDIFALGVVLYEMLAGRPPFAGRTAAEFFAALLGVESPPLPLDSVRSCADSSGRHTGDQFRTNYGVETAAGPVATAESPAVPVSSPEGMAPEDMAVDAAAAAELRRIVDRALRKDREQRYQRCGEMLADLRALRDELAFEERRRRKSGEEARRSGAAPPSDAATSAAPGRWFGARRAVVVAAVLVLLAVGAGFYRRSANLRWAQRAVLQIEALAGEARYFEAYDLAHEAKQYLPDDATIARWMPIVSDTISVRSEPSGARVYLRRASAAAPELIGVTPIEKYQVARGGYLLRLEKEGCEPFERTISNLMARTGNTLVAPEASSDFQIRLLAAGQIAARMVFVPGGRYKLASRTRLTDQSVELADYFIDRYEVTNGEYQEFIQAGGYFKPEYWRHPFVKNSGKDGRTLGFAEAMKEFQDRTGLPGPRSWRNQTFPEGQADHPVTDITWYEAAAYAVFRGKRLPTVFEWEKAARDGVVTYYSGYVLPWGGIDFGVEVGERANFQGGGTAAVDRFAFGMSPYGCYQMAGNVSEWCFNEAPTGFTVAGGSWRDPPYVFTDIGAFPGFYSADRIGFRCLIGADAGAQRIDKADRIPVYQPTSAAEFVALQSHYRYDRTPLDAEVRSITETPDWRREQITYRGTNDERVTAWLYLPKSARPPFQTLQFVPAGDVYGGFYTLSESIEMQMAPFIKSGRAVWAVVFRGFKEREHPPGYTPPRWTAVRRREDVVRQANDLSRGLDYLSTRSEVDAGRLAYYGYSQGAMEGVIYAAVENRYRAVVLVAAGMPPASVRWIAEASPMNFASHIRAPKLLLHGRYDEVHPLPTHLEPLYKLLAEPKRLSLYDAGHSPPLEVVVPAVNAWLDETLGAVRR